MKSLSLKQRLFGGLFFLMLQISIFIVYVQADQLNNLFWFCNHTPLLLAIAFFIGHVIIVKGILTVGLIPQLLWVVDYLSRLLLGVHLIGVTDYMFLGITPLSYISSLAAHLFSPIVAVLLVFRYPQEKKSLLYAAGYLGGLFALTLLFVPRSANINLIHSLPFWNITFPGYTLVWPVLAFLFLVLPTHFFLRWVYQRTSQAME